MIHAVKFKDGSAQYINRYLQTPRYLKEKQLGYANEIRTGALTCVPGVFSLLLKNLENFVGYDPLPGGSHRTKGQCNQSLVYHSKKIYALHEASFPFEFKVDKDKSGVFDIKSVGFNDFGVLGDTAFSAHAKVDADTGELFNLAWTMMHKVATYYRFDKNGQMTNKLDIELTSIRMVHDFLITKDFVVIPDLPLVFDTPKAMKTGKGALQFEKEDPTRYGFLPRDGKSQDDIIWIDVAEPHVCYLFVNAWQEGDKVVIHGCIWDELDMEAVQHKEHPDHVAGKCCFKRLDFDLKTKECKITRLIDEFVCDYPTINR